MADLNPNLILLQRPLPSPQDMASERQLRQIQQQELTLRAQEIAQRGEALRQQAMQRSQKIATPDVDPKKQMEAAQYQIFQAEQVADTLKRVQANPDLYPLAKQHIGQIFGPDVAAHLPETYDPDQVNAMIATGEKVVAQAKANLVPVDTVNEAGVNVRRFVTPKEGLEVPLAKKPDAAAQRPVQVETVDANGRRVTRFVMPEAGEEYPKTATATAAQGFTLAPGGRRYDAEGKLVATAPERPERAGVAAGPKPRAVTSGDANKIADFNNSLRDLDTLSAAVSGVAGATGPSAAVGAALPNFVTSITGWGTEAKEKQAVIDRVKQVIGKTLEGGVLRKEDEDKYKKILPVISDVPDVVTSKLQGLRTAIEQKRDEHLSGLEDAGYDTALFRARATATQAPPKAPLAGGVTVKAPNGKIYTFPNQAQADVFKKRAGIP